MYVCDFGLTQMKPKELDSLQYDPHGSPLYMAPEVFVGEYDEKCDVYSFGIIMWETITLQQAYQGISENLPAFMHQVFFFFSFLFFFFFFFFFACSLSFFFFFFFFLSFSHLLFTS